MPGALRFLVLLFLFISFVLHASGKAVNRTIDDTFGDSSNSSIKPIFLPRTTGVWEDSTCRTCAVVPEKSKAFRGTWTAATYNKELKNVSVTLPFAGTAIYVFFILANDQGPGITTTTECNFTLDGRPVGRFLHTPTQSKGLQYNESALVHTSTGLTNANHELLISTSGVDRDVFINFDYAIYTVEMDGGTPLPPPSTKAASPTSAPNQLGGLSNSNFTAVVIGTAVGGVAALAAAGLIIYFYCRRRKLERQFPGGSSVEGSLDGHRPMVSQAQLDSTSWPVAIVPPTPRDDWNPNTIPHTVTIPPNVASMPISRDHVSEDSDSDTFSYINQDSYATLPSGQIIMSPAIRQSRRITRSTHRPVTLALDNRTSVSTFGYPMSPAPTTPDMKAVRRRELEKQMQTIRKEMRYLEVEAAGGGLEDAGDGDFEKHGESDNLEDQIREMKDQLALFQSYMYSPWAKGLSDMPPPGYTPYTATQ